MLTQRLGSETQKNDKFIDSFIDAVKKNPKSCDEVWLASDYGFPSLDGHKKSADKLSSVSLRLREAGLRVSLQISNTIGHGEYMSSRDCSGLIFDTSPVGHMVGHDGKTAGYCFCWNDEYFRSYVACFIKEYVKKIKPYTVWFDDDMRATNHNPVSFGCFCSRCMKKFNTKYGTDFDRETLVQLINYDDLKWRDMYVEFLRESLGDFTYFVSKAVNEAYPDAYIGLQYCSHGAYDGYGYEHIFSAMKRASGKNPKSRPGGGAYNDHNPNEFIDKMQFIAFQNSMLPEYVTEKRPEIENLPDVKYGKTIAGTCFETTLYLAAGNNAMSYAMLMNDYEDMAWHSEMLSEFSRHRLYWEKLCEYSNNSTQGGLQMYNSKNMYRLKISQKEAPFCWNIEPYRVWTQFFRCGIPLSNDNKANPVYIIDFESARRFDKKDIEYLLTQPCICDGAALEYLINSGYGKNFGASCKKINGAKLGSVFTGHEINKDTAGKKWSQSFYCPECHVLCDTDGTTEPITVYTTSALDMNPIFPESEYKYGIADAIVKTSSGAKWAVFGQNLHHRIISSDRRKQIINAAKYLKSDVFCAELITDVQAIVLPRQNSNGQAISISIVNCTIGKSGKLKIRINKPCGKTFSVMSQEFPEEREIKAVFDGELAEVEIDSIAPWNVATVFIKE